MKPNWKQELKDPKGNVIKDGEKALTLEDFVYGILLLSDAQEQQSGSDKLAQAKLAKKVAEGKDITVEEAALIKKRVGKFGTPVTVLAVEEIFEDE